MKTTAGLRTDGLQLPIVKIDFETYYDQVYTLKKMSTSEYVRDARFKAHGAALRLPTMNHSIWVSGAKLMETLHAIDWSQTALLAHHTQFDGLILSHHFNVYPAFMYCTMSMARALYSHDVGASLDEVAKFLGKGAKIRDTLESTQGVRELSEEQERALGEYAIQDNDLASAIFDEMREGYSDDELKLIDITVRAFTDPVLQVDIPRAKKELEREIAYKQELINKAYKIIGAESVDAAKKILSSAEKYAAVLEQHGVEVPLKWSDKQQKHIPAIAKGDLEFQELEGHPNENVQALYHARLSVKSTLIETRAQRLIDHAKPALPIYLNYFRAHTGRWSGGDKLNPQNFGRNSELRRCIVAPKGHRLVVVDSGQIEARVLAWLAEQNDVLDVFREYDRGTGPDPYKTLAAEIYKKAIEEISIAERFVGKVGRLGLGFGMAAARLEYTLAAGVMGPPVTVPPAECHRAVVVYRRANALIVRLWGLLERILGFMLAGKPVQYRDVLTFNPDHVILPNGLALHYPELRAVWTDDGPKNFTYRSSKRGHRTTIYGGKFAENLVQALARNIVAEQGIQIAERYRVVLLVHDEVVLCVPTAEAKRAEEFAIEQMTTAPAWCADIPLAAEGGVGRNYGDAKP